MSSYSELIKNFEKTRAYMREFYVYGFKSRDEYDKKSARSYDDERRRLESWLHDHMGFKRTAEGKNVFISVDSRSATHNPFYKAWKSKSFTDGDITLHFILFDIFADSEAPLTLSEILEKIDVDYLSQFDSPMQFDESTVRKKLREYCDEGIVVAIKKGKRSYYKKADYVTLPDIRDVLDYFSEVAPCGVIGDFLLDKGEPKPSPFAFKHHYITGTADSDVLAELFLAMNQKRIVTLKNASRKFDEAKEIRLIPLKVFISAQNGRQHLLAYRPDYNSFQSFRLDYISCVKLCEETPRFDELRAALERVQSKMWGVNTVRYHGGEIRTDRIEFTVRVGSGEDYIVSRLEREKRVGMVEQVGEGLYRFTADVIDVTEMVPWIRTFICRITELKCTNREIERKFKHDLNATYRLYGIGEEDSL